MNQQALQLINFLFPSVCILFCFCIVAVTVLFYCADKFQADIKFTM